MRFTNYDLTKLLKSFVELFTSIVFNTIGAGEATKLNT